MGLFKDALSLGSGGRRADVGDGEGLGGALGPAPERWH